MAMCLDIEVTDDATVAEHHVDGPEGTVANLETVEQHVLAAVEMDEMRTQVVFAFGHLTVLHGNVGSPHGIQLTDSIDVGLWTLEPYFPRIHPWLQTSLARDGNILAVVGIDQRRIVIALRSLP